MYYLKTLFFNFLVVFFANHILPGIYVTSQTKLPHVGSDLIFAIALGALNSLIFPVLKLIRQEVTGLKIALIALILNFAVYAIVKLAPLGIHIDSVEGYILAAVVVTLGSFLTNFLEMKHYQCHNTDMPQ
jgi:uncharacterized membrane protein YvlD (DUF360 family)